VVFGPQRGDAHQDHRLLAELLPTEFRDQLILGYEILKWKADTRHPNAFHPQPDHVLLTLPDLYDEIRERYPQLDGRWSLILDRRA
jgi:hypothetical protein